MTFCVSFLPGGIGVALLELPSLKPLLMSPPALVFGHPHLLCLLHHHHLIGVFLIGLPPLRQLLQGPPALVLGHFSLSLHPWGSFCWVLQPWLMVLLTCCGFFIILCSLRRFFLSLHSQGSFLWSVHPRVSVG